MPNLREWFTGSRDSSRRTRIMPSGFLERLLSSDRKLVGKEAPPSPFLLPGTLVMRDGEYQIIEKFEGGETTVYRARDLLLDREVSLRRIDSGTKPDLIETVKILNRARRKNPVVASSTQEIYGLRTGLDGDEYLELEWVEGETLDKYWIRNLSRMVFGIATILKALNDMGLVHRDIKPSNIVLQDNSLAKIKLLDCFLLRGFGKNTGTEWDSMGTPAYSAPEQGYIGGFIGPKTDIYALGIMIWERLSGKVPNGFNYNGSFEKRFPELISSAWKGIVERCTQVEYDERWSADDILAFLRWQNRPRRKHDGNWQ